MSDVICPKCGELWDSFGITYAKGEGSLTVDEVARFLRGQGCPGCDFGTICPRCHGGRIENNECRTCFGNGYIFVQRCPRPADPRFAQWFFGYSNIPSFPLRFLGNVDIISQYAPTTKRGVFVYNAKIVCPDCHGEGEPCVECGGDGKFHPEKQPDRFDAAVFALLDSTDEEPICVLTEFVQ